MIAPAEISALLSHVDLVALFERWGTVERDGGRRFQTCCLWHEERTPSLKIFPDQGRFHCFGCGVHGNALDLVQHKEGLEFVPAVEALARLTGYWPQGMPRPADAPEVQPTKPALRLAEDRRREWTVMTPVPAKVPKATLGTFAQWIPQANRRLDPICMWEYRDGAGKCLGFDVRYEYAKDPKGGVFRVGDLVFVVGKAVAPQEVTAVTGDQVTLVDGTLAPASGLRLWSKAVITWTWCQSLSTGEQCWKMKRWEKPCPLFGLDRLAQHTGAAVLLVEGCKTASAVAIHTNLPDWVAVTWPGGASAIAGEESVDWSPLYGRTVTIWPDADAPGLAAAWHAVHHLSRMGIQARVVDVSGLPKGHDLADPLDAGEILTRMRAAAVPDAAWLAAHNPDAAAPCASDPAQPPLPPPADAVVEQDPDEPSDLLNEFADADRFIRDIEGMALYCPTRGPGGKRGDVELGWFVWDGKRFAASADHGIIRLARDTCRRISQEYLDQAQELKRDLEKEQNAEPVDKDAIKALRARLRSLYSRAERTQSEERLRRMISLARADLRIQVDGSTLDADPFMLNVANGTIDLRTGDLHPHHPRFRCTRIAAVPYIPDADRGPLLRVLERGLQRQTADGSGWEPDAARIAYLQDVCGQALYGHQRLQQFWLNLGSGGDGKGTFFEALLRALGGGLSGYAMKADMQSFIRTKVGGHRIRDDIANFMGARIVVADELNKGDQLDAAMVKAMSGESRQRVRHLFGSEFEFDPVCSLFLIGNHRPRLDSEDGAVWRRLVSIPWGPNLRDDERDPDVKERLNDPCVGGPGLLAWMVEGAIRTASAKRLPLPDSVRAETDAYRSDLDPLGDWIADDLRLSAPEGRTQVWMKAAGLVPALEAYQKENGNEEPKGFAISSKRIGARLRSMGCFSHTMRIGGTLSKVWVGVTLRSDHPLSVTYANGSVVPSDKEHRSALAGLVTVLPHCVPSPDAHAQGDTLARADKEGNTHGEIPTRARAAISTVSLSSRAPGEEGKRGNTVTEGTGSIPTWLTTDGEAPF